MRLMFTQAPAPADRQLARHARRTGTAGVARRLGKLLASGLVAALVLAHGQLLWQRIASSTLFEPWVALRWALTIAAIAGFIRLQRAGISIVWGRQALILWLLVLVCHAGVLSPAGDRQPLVEPSLLLAVSLSGLALQAIFGGRRAAMAIAPRARVARRPAVRPRALILLEPLSPRPPPVG